MAKRKKKTRRKKVKRAKRRPRRAPAAAGASGLQTAINGLNQYRQRLLDERTAIDERLSAIDSALQAMGTAPPAPRGRRAGGPGRRPRAGSLKDYIRRVMAGGGVMSVKDITEGVLRAGYKTRNKTLAKSVGIALTQMGDVRKVRRGQFRMN
jgi:hypothetical protein